MSKATYPCTDLGDGILDPFVGLDAKHPSDLLATKEWAIHLMAPMRKFLDGKATYPSPVSIRALRADQSENAHCSDPELFNETWSNFINGASDNPALFKFEDHYGYKSRYFVPWQLRINLPIAREMAFGYGLDWNGHMVAIDRLDPMYPWVLSDPLALYLRERAVVIARALKGKKHILCPSSTQLALEHVGLNTDQMKFNDDFGAQDAYDAVIMEGVSAYGLDSGKLIDKIDEALKKLHAGGTLFFDLCLEHWVYRRNRILFGCTLPLRQLPDAAFAVDLVGQILRNRPVVASFHVDSRNDRPVALLASLTKVC